MSSLAFRLLAAQQAAATNTNLYMWGNNTYGQLGTGTINTYYSWSQIHAGSTHTLALRNDGILFAWGNNSNGQLGDGTTVAKNSPVQIGYFSWNQVTTGYAHSAGIRNDGTIWAWGGNQYYQLNDNTTIDKSYPVLISSESWTSISAGALHTAAIKQDGTLWTWGSDDSGQLGNRILYTQLSAGNNHVAGLRTDGSLWIWGSNNNGQYGDNTTITKSTPTPTQVQGSWQYVLAGFQCTYAIKSDGTLWGWGYNNWGNLGQGDTVSRSFPTQIKTESNYIQLASQTSSSSIQFYVLNSLGQVFSMGNNSAGELGVNDTIPRSSPVQVSTTQSFTQIFSGGNYAFALTASNVLYGWGNNSSGSLGDNTAVSKSSPVVISLSNVASIVASQGITIALKLDNTLWGWGNNASGGVGDSTTINKSSPVQIAGTWNTVAISGSQGSVIAVDNTNIIYTWGYNGVGQLGLNDTVSRSSPTQLGTYGPINKVSISTNGTIIYNSAGTLYAWQSPNITGLAAATSSPVQVPALNLAYQQLTKVGTSSYSYVSSGKFHNTAVTVDNRLFTWGNNYTSQLGDATFITRSSPVQIAGSWTKASAGGNHTFGILSNSTLYSWGNNNYGQLGLDDASTLQWSKIHDGGNHLVAVRSDGALFTWGQNTTGQLGDGTTFNRSSPVQIGSESWSNVTAGLSHTLAIRADGKLFAWGNNSQGQLGQGYASVGASWSQVSIGSQFVVAIKNDGTLWAWGFGTAAQIGNGASLTVSYPIQIGNEKWLRVDTAATHTLAIRADGTLWAWGQGSSGQLGQGTAIASNSPILVLPITTNVANIFAGQSTSGVIAGDGKLYMWGANGTGQLGDNTTVSRNSPTLLGSSWIAASCSTHTLAINYDGTLWAWGTNTNGQIGASSTITRSSPVQIASGSWTTVTTGLNISAAIKVDGSLWTWGIGTSGGLGDGTTISRSSPLQIGTNSWINVYALTNAMLATRVDGTIWAWGLNTSGQLGTRDAMARSSPVQISASGPILAKSTDLIAGYLDSGKLNLWGASTNSAFGDGTTANRSSPVQLASYANTSSPTQIGTDNWSQVAAGGYHVLGIKTDNSLYAWGLNNSGQIGGAAGVLNPVVWNKLVGNTLQTFGIRSDGRLFAWGNNADGRLGDGSTVTRSSPVVVTNDTFANIASGDAHTLAITTDGRLYGWGKNDYGQAGALSWVQVSTSLMGYFTAAIRSDGALFSWGDGTQGQLGDNTIVTKSSPVAVFGQTISSTPASWVSIAAGEAHAIAIRNDSTLWTWGYNVAGQLGDYTTVARSSPVQVGTVYQSLLFNGTTDYITVTPNTGLVFGTGDFTIEMYIMPTAYPAAGVFATQLYDTRPAGTGSTVNYQLINFGAGGAISYSSGTVGIFGGFIPLNQWTHIAVSRQSSNTKLFLNGLQVGSTTVDTTSYIVGASRPIMGTDGNVPNSAGYNFTGAMSNIRVVKGVAVYTGNFTVPTSPLQVTQSSGTNIQAITAGQTSLLTGQALYDRSGNVTVTPAGSLSYILNGPFSPNPFATSFLQVAVSTRATLVLTNQNTLWLWGLNTSGELGDGTTISRSSPVQLAGSWTSIAGGNATGAAINTLGNLYIWGLNTAGMLGDGTTLNRSSPVQIAGSWSQISFGQSHAVGIKADGTLWAWGNGLTGALGQGSTDNNSRSSPVQVGTFNNWVQVVAGLQYSVARNTDGILYAWGQNGYGQFNNTISWSNIQPSGVLRSNGLLYNWGENALGSVGDGTTANRSSPIQIGSTSWSLLSRSPGDGSKISLAIKPDGSLWAWGYNNFGQLGTNDTVYRSSPVQIGIDKSWIKAYAGNDVSFAIDSTNTLWGWGYNTQGTVGDYTGINRSSPVQIGTDQWNLLSQGNSHVVGINTQGKLYGWGSNIFGQVINTGASFAQLGNAVALRSDGQLWIWGINTGGVLGDSTTISRSSPVQIGGVWKAVNTTGQAGVYYNTVGIKIDGTLWSWGNNTAGALGDGTTISRSSPAQVGTDNNWLYVAKQNNSTTQFAIKTDGTLWVWGQNSYGSTGDNTTIARSSPVQVPVTNSWIQVVADSHNVFAIDIERRLYTWGNNIYGQLGTNDTVNRSSPVQVPGSWSNISVAYNTVAAVDTLGRLYTWGWGQNGSLGNSTTIARSSPVQIGSSSWSVVGMTFGACAAITVDGKLFTWGGLVLGDNAASPRSSPVQVGTSSWSQVASGYFSQLAVTIANTLYSWSSNSYQMGDNTTVTKNVPTLTSSINLNLVNTTASVLYSPVLIGSSSWVSVAAGPNQTAAIKLDNTLWTWGTNTQGQLGSGTTLARSSPVQVGASSWSVVSTGGLWMAAITSDNKLFTWGYNILGNLGSATTVSRSSPVQLGASSWTQVTTAFYTGFGVDVLGRLFAWGNNAAGQLGTNETVSRSSPVQVGNNIENPVYSPVQMSTSSWSQVTAGFQTVLSIADNRLWGIGYNGIGGQLGDSTLISRSSLVQLQAGTQSAARSFPVQIVSGSWTGIAAGSSFSAAIRNDGKLFTWGINSAGQVGDSTSINRSYPTQVGVSSWNQVNAGVDFVVAKNSVGNLYAWGNGWSGSLGQNDQRPRSSPVQIGTESWSQLATGGSHVVATRNDTLYGWGRNSEGQLLAASDILWSAVQPNVAGNTVFGIDTLGRLFAWGQLGVGISGVGYQDNSTVARSRPVQIAVGQSFTQLSTNVPGLQSATFVVTFVIDTNGRLWGWGNNTNGAFGDGTTISRSSPVQLGAGQQWKKICVGVSAVAGLTTGGSIFTWGSNSNGELGDGTTINRSNPVQILGSWADVSLAYNTTLAVRTDGSLYAWGANANQGSIGDGTTVSRSSPVQISANKLFRAVAGGLGVSFAIDSNDGLFAWGNNSFGQFGDNSTVYRSSPVQIGSNTKWKTIASGGNSTFATTTDDLLYTWGLNTSGQLGDSTTVSRSSPVQLTTVPKIRSMTAGNDTIPNGRFIDIFGKQWATGLNTNGVLGDGTTIARSAPVQITLGSTLSPVQISTSNFTSISAGSTHTAVVTSNNKLFVWGGNGSYQLGDGTSINRNTIGQIGIGQSFVIAAAIGNTTFGGTSFGTYNVGENVAGQLGINTVVTTSALTQVTEPFSLVYTAPLRVGTSSWASIAAGTSHSVAIKIDNTLWSWGENITGSLGDNTTVGKSSPVQIGTSSWISVSAGKDVTGAIRVNRSLYMWGVNASGQLGDGTTVTRSSPVQLQGYWSDIEIGGSFSTALNVNGTIWSWGNTQYGVLGPAQANVAIVSRSSPVQVTTGTYNYISTSENSLTAIDSFGNLYSVGDNLFGQLGTNAPYYSWSVLSGGIYHLAAIRSDGSLWMWGRNTAGQLGLGDTLNRSSPVQIGTNSWTNVSASVGGSHAVAIRNDNTTWAWGLNTDGQLGDGTTISKSSPVQISTVFTNIAAGGFYTLATISDGTLYSWGRNSSIELGIYDGISRSSPTQVPTSVKFNSISAGGSHSLAISTDATLYSWGSNVQGQAGQNTQPFTIAGTVDTINYPGFITSQGKLYTWGLNTSGSLGDNTTVGRSSPVQLGTDSDWYKIFPNWSDFRAGAFLKTDNTLWVVGRNVDGLLGLGDTIDRSSPVQLSAGVGRSWTYFSVGLTHSLGIKDDGTLWTMGLGGSGRLGDNTTISRSSPVQVAGTWTTGSTGNQITFAIRSNGTLWSWGSGNNGAIGDGTTTNRSSPVQLGVGNSFTMVRAGEQSGHAIDILGRLYAWGLNTSGKLGDNSTVAKTGLVAIAGSYTYVITGSDSSAAIRSDGTLWAWGAGALGQLGDGTTISRSSPVQVTGGLPAALAGSWTNVFTTDGVSYGARKLDGSLYVWGRNVGNKTYVGYSSPIQLTSVAPTVLNEPTKVGTSSWNMISASISHSAGINATGNLFTWGSNIYGQLGYATSYTHVYVGNLDSGVVKSNGTLWTMGYNLQGQIGDNTAVDRSSAVQISASGQSYKYVLADQYGSFGIRTDGTLWAWGLNSVGQLGLNDTVNKLTPVQVGSDTNWAKVIINLSNTTGVFALKTNGTLYSWGNNNNGQLGDGTVVARSSPVQIPGSFSQIFCGGLHVHAIRSDGLLFGWGINTSGQLGDGTTVTKLSPVQIGTSSWATVGNNGSGTHTVAIRSDGTLWAWGLNTSSQVGDGTVVARSSPVQIGIGFSWSSVATGYDTSAALSTTGKLYVWGFNAQGQAGDGTTVLRTAGPTPTLFDRTWASIYFNAQSAKALATDGTLWGWGYNIYGQLGDNTTISRSSPVQLSTLEGRENISIPTQVGTSSWASVSAGDLNTLGLINNTLYTWGGAGVGELMDGTITARSSPVQVGGTSTFSKAIFGGATLLAVNTNDPLQGTKLVTSGFNVNGQLGDNSVVAKTMGVPVLFSIAQNASSPMQVGSSLANYRSSPVQVGSNSWTSVSAGDNHSLGIDSSSSLFGWGYNVNGQVGDSTTINKSSPVQISTSTDWVEIEAGYNYSAVEKSDGSIYTFGNNSDGQLGDGT